MSDREITLIVEEKSMVLRKMPEPFASDFALHLGDLLGLQVVRVKMLMHDEWRAGQVEVLRG